MDGEQWMVKWTMSKSYRDLLVWQKGIALVKEIYILTRDFPKQEIYSLANQVQRAAVSIPSNIAEGQARQHTTEFRQFLYIALGSLAEVDTQLEVALQLSYLDQNQIVKANDLVLELRKMLYGLINNLPKSKK
ncbi:MAG: four helix bundle protein [Anaerolineae bacterium]|nr:four helix bundle protein [Anaerolineae bacterium]